MEGDANPQTGSRKNFKGVSEVDGDMVVVIVLVFLAMCFMIFF